jgi:ABC-2 type transport system ATP-binding protein
MVPIEISNVTKVFRGGTRALHDVTFRIVAGERACLLGPNGAGKTTLIRLLTGALRPTHGILRLFGATAADASFLAAKRRTGIVPQAPGMYRDLRVGEYLSLVRALYDRGAVAETACQFGLEPYLDRPMTTLSGGFQRRLTLAAALLPQPELLLLDEPTVGLDPVAAREVHQVLQTAMAGRTVLLCTHNLVEADALCDSAIILRHGRVLLHERIAALRRRAQPQLVLAAAQGVAPLAAALEHLGFAPHSAQDTVSVALEEPRRQAPLLLRSLLANGLDVYECRVHEPSLEELFLQTVGRES